MRRSLQTAPARLATGAFHLMQRPQFTRIRFQFFLYVRPLKPLMAARMLLKPVLQRVEQVFALFF